MCEWQKIFRWKTLVYIAHVVVFHLFTATLACVKWGALTSQEKQAVAYLLLVHSSLLECETCISCWKCVRFLTAERNYDELLKMLVQHSHLYNIVQFGCHGVLHLRYMAVIKLYDGVSLMAMRWDCWCHASCCAYSLLFIKDNRIVEITCCDVTVAPPVDGFFFKCYTLVHCGCMYNIPTFGYNWIWH